MILIVTKLENEITLVVRVVYDEVLAVYERIRTRSVEFVDHDESTRRKSFQKAKITVPKRWKRGDDDFRRSHEIEVARVDFLAMTTGIADKDVRAIFEFFAQPSRDSRTSRLFRVAGAKRADDGERARRANPQRVRVVVPDGILQRKKCERVSISMGFSATTGRIVRSVSFAHPRAFEVGDRPVRRYPDSPVAGLVCFVQNNEPLLRHILLLGSTRRHPKGNVRFDVGSRRDDGWMLVEAAHHRSLESPSSRLDAIEEADAPLRFDLQCGCNTKSPTKAQRQRRRRLRHRRPGCKLGLDPRIHDAGGSVQPRGVVVEVDVAGVEVQQPNYHEHGDDEATRHKAGPSHIASSGQRWCRSQENVVT